VSPPIPPSAANGTQPSSSLVPPPAANAVPDLPLLIPGLHPAHDPLTELRQRYPLFSATLESIKQWGRAKAYSHCIKYRIFNALKAEMALGHQHIDNLHAVACLFIGEQEHTWRNINSRCKKVHDCWSKLSTLDEEARTALNDLDDTDYHLIRNLMDGPFPPFSTDGHTQNQETLAHALNLPSTHLNDLTRRVMEALNK
jgi:hypothetical protein